MLVSLWFLLLFVLNDDHLSVTQAFHMITVMPRSITSSRTTGFADCKSSTKTVSATNSMILQAHDCHHNDPSFFPPSSSTANTTTRRNLMNHAKNAILMAAGAASSWTRTNHAYATVINTSSPSSVPLDNDTLETGLLESRVLENLLSPPTYGMEASDVYYPDYFNGVWQVKSYTKSIQAPCGIVLFGGNVTYTKALEEIHAPPLSYKARFIPSSNTYTTTATTAAASIASIADREYNVKEIANAAMGYNSVLDVILSPSSSTLKSSTSSSYSSSSSNSMPSPNKISVVLAPKGSNQIVQADLITLARRYETINPLEFHASEVVRQIVAPIQNNNKNGIPSSTTTQKNTSSSSSTLLKEIETISLYKAEPNVKTGNIDKITCVQRSATFLLPSQQDPMAYKMWEATRGRPIDVRFYNVEYTKV